MQNGYVHCLKTQYLILNNLHSLLAVDRTLSSTLSDAKDAAINAVLDLLGTYKAANPSTAAAGLVTSSSTRLLPLFVLALLKHVSSCYN